MNILTVCTGNICRSPMAEGILRDLFLLHQDIKVVSAGTHAIAGNPATEFAIFASGERGIDITEHRARPLDTLLVKRSDLILCMEISHAEWTLSLDSSAYDRVFNLADFSVGREKKEIGDPYGCSLRDYRLCFEEINSCIRRFAEIKQLA